MVSASIFEAKTKLSQLIKQTQRGEGHSDSGVSVKTISQDRDVRTHGSKG